MITTTFLNSEELKVNNSDGAVTWVYNTSSPVRIKSEDSSSYLIVSPVSRDHAGDFTCYGTNGYRNNTPATTTKRLRVECKSDC